MLMVSKQQEHKNGRLLDTIIFFKLKIVEKNK